MKQIFVFTTAMCFLIASCDRKNTTEELPFKKEDAPKIVNIINFIRLCEPRIERFTNEVLYETVVEQIKMMKQYNLGGTFLLQYDALLDPKYQKLLKALPDSTFEIGVWWEIPQPLVENAGYKWRGRYPWDWHADVGFSTGYTQEERERLVDTYMADFKKIYGYYPKSVGSWFIDAHTLNYFSEKYGIIASCNCKDQIGTDGYSMWGGYWNQAYYPSKKNAYMPAQNEANQIPVPIFRMLGSDPVRQYDKGLGTNRQGVISLEPVYTKGGGDSTWVNWYFEQFIEGACMEYAYVQAGQENSFTWNRMLKGFELQMPLIAKLRDEKKLQVETLEESGRWFREKYKTTPATSVTVNEDINGGRLRTTWFNSRFFRTNLLWEDNTLRFRDIHIFNENLASDYVDKKGTSTQCFFYTLPFVDGFNWSSTDKVAGLRFKTIKEGKEVLIEGGVPEITDEVEGQLSVHWPIVNSKAVFIIQMDEKKISISLEGEESMDWFLDLSTSDRARLPFTNITEKNMNCSFKGMDYLVSTEEGVFSQPGKGTDFRIAPEKNSITLFLAQKSLME